MSQTYAEWVAFLARETVIDATDPDFLGILPACIDYAEQRIYRELDLLTTVTRQNGTLTVGVRLFTLPTTAGRFVVTNGFNVLSADGSRNQLIPVSRDVIDAFWGVVTTGLPKNYAMLTDQQILIGPAPDAAYTIEVIGTIRPTPLSASNASTYLTLYLPDLWDAATMVFMTGYQKNWGAQADDPKAAVSWQQQYDALFASANVEEMRKKYSSGAWGSLQPTPIATPNR